MEKDMTTLDYQKNPRQQTQDLGKACLNGKKVGKGYHPQRSIDILNQCGVELTDLEREVIRFHHPKGIMGKVANAFRGPLQLLLHIGDCSSTRINKRGDVYRFSRIQDARPSGRAGKKLEPYCQPPLT